MRRLVGLVLGAAFVAACSSGGDAGEADSGETLPSTTLSVGGATTTAPTAPSTTTSEVAAVPAPQVDVVGQVDGTAFELSQSPDDNDELFGPYAACSGLAGSFTSYSVSVASDAQATGAVSSITIISAEPVTGPGTVEAAIIVEIVGDDEIPAVGTMSIDDGLMAGEFTGVSPEGSETSGSFECTGADEPAPLDLDSPAVEVSMLLSSDDQQRFAAAAANVDDALEAGCGDISEGGSIVIVPPTSGGGVSAFRLAGGETPTLEIAIGAAIYEFGSVVVSLADDDMSGSFTADSMTDSADVEVFGAFRCS